MKLTEQKEVTEKKRVTIGYQCDNCGTIHNGDTIPESWYNFTAHHEEFGCNIHDTMEDYMACSLGCCSVLLPIAIEDFKNYNSTIIKTRLNLTNARKLAKNK